MRNQIRKHAAITGLVMLLSLASAVDAQERLRPNELEILDAHNQARLEVGLEPFIWNHRLASDAEEWARYLAETNQFKHADLEGRDGQGENIWMGTKGYWTDREKIAAFINERKDFRFGVFPNVSKTGRWSDVGHYTQIIWPETREVGCAIVTNRTDDYLVCRYLPAGNVVGRKMAPATKTRK